MNKIPDIEYYKLLNDYNKLKMEKIRLEDIVKELKKISKNKDLVQLLDEITKLKKNNKDISDKLKDTLTLLSVCNTSKEKEVKKLIVKIDKLVDDKDDQDILIAKLKKLAKEKLVEIIKLKKELEKRKTPEEKKKEKEEKDKEEKERKEKEKKERERKERERKENERKEKERKEKERKEKERKEKKEEQEKNLKEKQKKATEEFKRKREQEKKEKDMRSNIKEQLENKIKSIYNNLSLYSINSYFKLNIDIPNLNLKKYKKLVLLYHPDRAINKSLNEQIKYEVIFNSINNHKNRIGGRRKYNKKKKNKV